VAKFKIILDKRVPLKDGRYNLAVRVSHKKEVMILKLQKLTQQQYDIVFVKKSMDDKSVEFRRKSHGYINKCETIFTSMDVFDRYRFRELFYKDDDDFQSPDNSLKIKNLFDIYLESCTNAPSTKDHYRMVGRIIETFHPGATVDDITIEFLNRFEIYILNGGSNSPATVDSYMRNLRRIIRYFIHENPLISKSFSYPFGRGRYVIGSYWPKKP
jgi:hypothetical protein